MATLGVNSTPGRFSMNANTASDQSACSTPTTPRSLPIVDPIAAAQVAQFEKNCTEFGIPHFGFKNDNQGIVHVIGPENGATQPGMTVVCGDSHTATHGAFGALAFGIGTSEVEMVLATQCLLQRKSKTFNVKVEGALGKGVTAKDIILALIARIGVGGGTGCVIEYTGSAIRALTMEQRMTVCNMSIEGGARAGLIAPDDKTYEFLAGRKLAPKGAAWDAAVAKWRTLPTDEGATYDKEIFIDASALEPMITFGTNPGQGIAVTQPIPDPGSVADAVERDAEVGLLRQNGLAQRGRRRGADLVVDVQAVRLGTDRAHLGAQLEEGLRGDPVGGPVVH